MMIKLTKLTVQTRRSQELVDVTDEVERVVAESGVGEGLVYVMTSHTSSGVLVTEGLECLERDVVAHLERLAPDQGDYWHNRYLDIDGRLGFNAGAHLKGVISGYFAYFPISGGKIVKGGRQRVYFAEYDGPLSREYYVQVIGE
ncbi:MAG: YjbQ family protein [Chloroflexi bacterium]|nr:YjbQ family protein [Chloroflexota bacterium]